MSYDLWKSHVLDNIRDNAPELEFAFNGKHAKNAWRSGMSPKKYSKWLIRDGEVEQETLTESDLKYEL